MVRLRPTAVATALAAAAVALAACGDSKPSAAQQRKARADYVRAADAVCAKARTRLTSDRRPRSYEALGAGLHADEVTLRSSGDELHGLHERLGESATTQTRAFDAHIDDVLTATLRTGTGARDHDAGATRRAAAGLRQAWDALYRAAQPAALRECGRGGNRVADKALFTTYRYEYYVINADVYGRLKRLRKGSGSFEAYRSNARRALRLLVNYRSRIGRLSPPLDLRTKHHRLLRLASRSIRSGTRLIAIFDRGPAAVARPGTLSLLNRFEHQINRADAAERSLRRTLRDPRSRRGDSLSSTTNSA